MLTRLRRQLTLLSAACTGAVLLAMALAALSLAEGQLRAGSEAGFLSSANAIIAKLRSDRVVSTTWLAQLESGEGLIISLRDQGAPLSFSGAWTPRTARPPAVGACSRRRPRPWRGAGQPSSLPHRHHLHPRF